MTDDAPPWSDTRDIDDAKAAAERAAHVAGEAAVAAAKSLGKVVDGVDSLVPVAPSIDNQVLTDKTPGVRWAGTLFAVCAAVLVPWTVILGVTLPGQVVTENYDLAWVGFDVLLLAGVGATGFTALRRSRFLGTVASATAALLVVDAWFDVVITPGRERLVAVVMAVLVELPLAALCVWLSLHAADIAEKRLQLLLRVEGGGSVRAGLQRLRRQRDAVSPRPRP